MALIETDRKGSISGDVIELKEHSLDNGAELFTLRAEYVLVAIYSKYYITGQIFTRKLTT